MPRLAEDRVPRHRRRPDGRGVVTIPNPERGRGDDVYTGTHGTKEAEENYRRAISEWIARGRTPLPREGDRSVARVASAYLVHARRKFTKRGRPTTWGKLVERVMADVVAWHGADDPASFGPRTLRDVRARWMTEARPGKAAPANRRTAHGYARIVVEMFRWAAEREMIDAALWHRLQVVKAPEPHEGRDSPPPRRSAPKAAVEATLGELRRGPAADILRLIELTGMRPGEACVMRGSDVERSGEVWAYRVPADWNKTERSGRSRVVYLGPRAQAIVGPRIDRHGDGYLFRPTSGPRRATGPYRRQTLAALVAGASGRSERGASWSPNHLRHSAATRVDAALGTPAAQAMLGHGSARTTAIYVDPDRATLAEREAAREAALALG
jgi:integrase